MTDEQKAEARAHGSILSLIDYMRSSLRDEARSQEYKDAYWKELASILNVERIF